MPLGPNPRGQGGLPLLIARDECSDAFGSNASNSICNPSMTLCCVWHGQPFPSCHQYLGNGWCCAGSDAADICHVDQPSNCDDPSSVPCTNLEDGTAEACCPRLTTCDPTIKASKDAVRCNIQYGDLKRAAQASPVTPLPVVSSPSTATTDSADATTTTLTTTTSSSASTASSTSSTSWPVPASNTTTDANSTMQKTSSSSSSSSASSSLVVPSQSQGPAPAQQLPAGLIAGAAVGATLGLVSLVLLGYLFFRKLAKKRRRLQEQQQGGGGGNGGNDGNGNGYPYHYPPPPPAPLTYHDYHRHPPAGEFQQGHDYPYYAQVTREVGYGYQPGSWKAPVEMMAKSLVETDGPVELASEDVRVRVR
ncbi:uncharacterized protein THITE_2119167 [Thermothielavioides terrestris NRRL 8126]|uniref:Mid2 domain-containing protein n=1 Tax=Thermothielavioides terrestris (strain ATCC 38088 / NRRL 8126) TaxID=578455 RepID=G2RBF2_THETT|nr:uncharacterized protein THITE_2119167 [Thermothielavioides terrestris NRRL 8126]AEO69123.1 hypothetical protein THITE_2119167 [Thermothielavioides terrestris NRRL 8126]